MVTNSCTKFAYIFLFSIEIRIKSEKQKVCQQNETCKKEVTECLQRHMKNLKEIEISKEIKLKIEEVYKNIEKKVETACAKAENKQWQQSSLLLDTKLVNVWAWFSQTKCPETWANFRCEILARSMSIHEYENKYTCPSCQKQICKQEFERHYVEFIYYGKCKKFDKNGYIVS